MVLKLKISTLKINMLKINIRKGAPESTLRLWEHPFGMCRSIFGDKAADRGCV